METFSTSCESVATGTNKTLINLFNPAATPISRGRITEVIVGGSGTPGDNAAIFRVARSTAVGTEGSGFTPNNIDPSGPAGAYDSGLGVFSAEPTYTSDKQLLVFPLNHRTTFRWVAAMNRELVLAATQNNGAGLYSVSSTSTQAYSATILFTE